MLNRRRIERHRARGELECALRVLEGAERGLSTRWRHGRARLTPGRISFRVFLWQLRIPNPFVGRVDLDVVLIDNEPEQAPWRQLWSINPSMPVLRMQTSNATLALVVPHGQVEWVLGVLEPED